MDNNNQNFNINNINNNNQYNNNFINNNIYQQLLNKLNNNKNNNNNPVNNNYINNNNPGNNNEENQNDEEEEEYEEESNIKKIEEKNFSQQVDFLYHPNNPDDQSSIKNILIKQYKKQKKIIPNNTSSKKSSTKKNIKKPKTKNNFMNDNDKKGVVPYSNKNKGLFDPYLTQKELDYESKINKQREERQKKIAEYEKNKSKKKLQDDINKKIINYAQPKGKPLIKAKNYAKKKIKKNQEDLIKHFVKIPKPTIQKKVAENYGFNPRKYEIIINSLLNEINDIKNERKKENEMFKKQIQLYANDNVDKYNNYYEFIYKNQKLNYENTKIKNPKKDKINKPTRGQAINNLMIKYFDKDNSKFNNKADIDIINGIDKNKKDNLNNNNFNNNNNNIKKNIQKKNNKNNLPINNQSNINEINFDNIDKLLSAENLSFQDKINILTEINKNVDNYYNNMPIIVDQVKTSLNKLYEKEIDNNNFRKEANKIPFIAMASKAAYQLIQSNNDKIIDDIIDEMLYECTYDLNMINKTKKNILKKQQLINELDNVKNNINNIKKNEEDILAQSNLYKLKKKEELKIKCNDIDNNNKNKKCFNIIKFKAHIDDNFISERDKYKNEFKNYMIFKGSFYHNDIFNIYDEYIEEEAQNLLNILVDYYLDDIHKFAGIETNNEINNIEK